MFAKQLLCWQIFAVGFLLTYSCSEAFSFNHSLLSRQPKILKLFSVVRFENTACNSSVNVLTTNSTPAYEGTCLTSNECASHGGLAAGACAGGFGVCCIIVETQCETTTAKNLTYFQSNAQQYFASGQCLITVNKCAPEVCQIRLDLVQFSIQQPDPRNGICSRDIFIVSGTSIPVPPICGTNTGQHGKTKEIPFYLHYKLNQNRVAFGFVMSPASANTTRSWVIKITQIPCNGRYHAPEYCIQYFTGSTGKLESFNFQFQSLPQQLNDNGPFTNGRQLANQDYNICLRTEEGFCGIGYSVCDDPSFSARGGGFTISNIANEPQLQSRISSQCRTDWLSIPCAHIINRGTPQPDCVFKFCGTRLNSVRNALESLPVYSYYRPFQLHFYSDGTEADTNLAGQAERGNLGFCLRYEQLACNLQL